MGKKDLEMRRGNERAGRPDSAKEDGIRMRTGKDRQAVLKGLSIFINFVKSINICQGNGDEASKACSC